MKRTSNYHATLLEALRDPQEAAAYLQAAAEESPEALALALFNVAEALRAVSAAPAPPPDPPR